MERVRIILFWCMIMGFGVPDLVGMIVFAGEAIHSFHTELGTMRMVSLAVHVGELHRYRNVEDVRDLVFRHSLAGDASRR